MGTSILTTKMKAWGDLKGLSIGLPHQNDWGVCSDAGSWGLLHRDTDSVGLRWGPGSCIYQYS